MRLLARAAAAAALCATVLVAAASAETLTLNIDPSHSNVGFKVRHFFAQVPGEFKDVSGTITADPTDWSSAKVEATIQAASINTNNAKRDDHLKSADFFDVEKFPTITFVSKSVQVGKDGKGKMTGDFTMRGVTKPVTLDVEVLGSGKGMGGQTVAGFVARTTINRQDYGVSWNRVVEGAQMLSDDVAIELNVEAKTKPAGPPPGTPAPAGDKK
jgi:polyisoprenoid-binding protein YceI